MKPGTYDGVTAAACITNDKEGPGTSISVKVRFDSGEEMNGSIRIIKKDGSFSEKGIDSIKEIFTGGAEWDWDLFSDTMPEAHAGKPVSCVVIEEPGYKDPTKMFSKIQFINARGNRRDLTPGKAPAVSLKDRAKTPAAAASPASDNPFGDDNVPY